jgi:hypothetical protein
VLQRTRDVIRSTDTINPDALSHATRYLCVAARIDDKFADGVFAELFGDELRAVAPSFGFDVRTVAYHCLAGRRHRRTRDIILVVIAALTFLLAPATTILAGVFWWTFGWLVRGLQRTEGRIDQFMEHVNWKAIMLAMVGLMVALIASVSYLGFVFVSSGLSIAAVLGSLFLPVLGWAALYAVVLWDRVSVRAALTRELRWDVFRTRTEPALALDERMNERLEAIATAQRGNVTVYSGYRPFVGCGTPINGWSFVLPIEPTPTREKDDVIAFSTLELIDHVRQVVSALAPKTDEHSPPAEGTVAMGLSGLHVDDRIFVSGLAIAHDKRFLRNHGLQPSSQIPDDEVQWIASHPYGAVRHYLSVYVQSWDGEVIPFTFLHFSTDGKKLYIECARSVLRPIRAQYRVVDVMASELTSGDLSDLVTLAASQTVSTVLSAPGRVIADIRFNRRQGRPRPPQTWDYGARLGVRELGAAGRFHLYFQELDADKHFKIVEAAALGAVAEFLDQHNVDTSDFNSHRTTIVNSGIIQTGGTMATDVQSVGTGSTATKSEAKPEARRAPTSDRS